MRRTSWVWLAGCIAWTVDAVVNVLLHSPQRAELALLVAVLFGIAFLFYRGQKR
jgi:hypothetical protein